MAGTLGKRDLKPLAAAAIAAIVYLPTLNNYPVADSWAFMMPHSFFEVFGYFFKTMLPPEFNALWLRPIPMFTFWFDTLVWPGTAWGPHLVNVAFHALNVWLVWKLVRTAALLSGAKNGTPVVTLGSAAAALIYGLHPLGVGSVAWIAARFDVMSVTFGLAGTIFWMRHEAGKGGKWTFPLSLLLLAGSLLSKEQGIVFMASCFLLSFAGMKRKKGRAERIREMTSLAVLVIVYVIWRLIIFKGLGGYLEARHGLSAKPPAFYLVALLYPWRNVIDDPAFTATFTLAILSLAGFGFFLWRTAGGVVPVKRINGVYFMFAGALLAFSLATNAPNPGMTFEKIMGHAESRFALNAITAISILAGLAVIRSVGTPGAGRGVVAGIMIFGIALAWRTDVQVQAWDDSSATARDIVESTLRQSPDPPRGARLLFFDIPLTNDQWAYIFGVGLEEALLLEYRRPDIDIIRYPKRSDLRSARPGRDAVFRYNTQTERLERLHAEKPGEEKQ